MFNDSDNSDALNVLESEGIVAEFLEIDDSITPEEIEEKISASKKVYIFRNRL